MAELGADAQNVVQIFRSLCTSRKVPATLRMLSNEYCEMEGFLPPKCGFATVEDLLRASGQFDFIVMQGQLCVKARSTAESAHIVEMLQKQKSKRPKRVNTGYAGMGYGRYISAFNGRPQARPSARPPFARPIYGSRPPMRNFNNNNAVQRPFNQRFPSNVPKPLRSIVPVPVLRQAPPIFVTPGMSAPRNVQQPQTAPVVKTQPSYVPQKPPQSAGLLPSQRTREIIPSQATAQMEVVAPKMERKPSFREIKVPQQPQQQQPSRPIMTYEIETFNDDPKTDMIPNVINVPSNYTSNGKTELPHRSSNINNNNNNINVSNGSSEKLRKIPARPSVQGRLEIARHSSTEKIKIETQTKEVSWSTYHLFNLILICHFRRYRDPNIWQQFLSHWKTRISRI